MTISSIATLDLAESTVELQEQIRRRAYVLYESCGKEHEYDVDAWLQAKSELAAKLAMATKGVGKMPGRYEIKRAKNGA